jgi:hypothetical protein
MHFAKAEMACSKMSKVIKGRSARNSESEVNSNRSVSLGRQGWLDYVNFGYLCSPHLSRCPKFTIAPYSSPVRGVHRTLSDAWQKLPLVRLPGLGCRFRHARARTRRHIVQSCRSGFGQINSSLARNSLPKEVC